MLLYPFTVSVYTVCTYNGIYCKRTFYKAILCIFIKIIPFIVYKLPSGCHITLCIEIIPVFFSIIAYIKPFSCRPCAVWIFIPPAFLFTAVDLLPDDEEPPELLRPVPERPPPERPVPDPSERELLPGF